MSDVVNNFLTVDVEEWFHANYHGMAAPTDSQKDTRLTTQMHELLNLCSHYHVRGTFFVVGQVAEKYPEIVDEISSRGHEVASHSHAHRLVYDLEPAEFQRDLRRSILALRKITKKRIQGFRAPSWSVTPSVLDWYYRILHEEGVAYSSSIFPIKTPLYGIPHANPRPHKARPHGVWEIPNSIATYGPFTFGFAGGFYLRVLPAWFVVREIQKRLDRDQSTIIYLHPREIDPSSHRIPLNAFNSFIHYWGVGTMHAKLEKLLQLYGITMHHTLGDIYAV